MLRGDYLLRHLRLGSYSTFRDRVRVRVRVRGRGRGRVRRHGGHGISYLLRSPNL